jgi:NAD-dependent DNA ligase
MNSLVQQLEAASHAYHNGLPELMTDDEYDTALDKLRDMDPSHPFLQKVGAPLHTGDEVTLPIPLPSLNKAKPTTEDLKKWLAKNPADRYIVSTKLDGCSALWLPKTQKLYTRGDGTKGRDISGFAPHIRGLVTSSQLHAVRGELIMLANSPMIPPKKMARNIVAGALNRQKVDSELFSEIRFVAYELIDPPNLSPYAAHERMKKDGFEVAMIGLLDTSLMTEEKLSESFDTMEKRSVYQLDGIVVAPNLARSLSTVPSKLSGNPTDRIAWKARRTTAMRRTTVRSVEWNISHQGYLIPRVLFDSVDLQGASISAATGLHGRWIFQNKIGPGAEIEIRRAGDTIPQIMSILKPAETASMPARYVWDGDSASAVHIRPVEGDSKDETAMVRLTHALSELGAENVGPGLVTKLYAAGFNTVGKIYAATPDEFAARVAGCKEKMAQKIYDGLRVKTQEWTESMLMCASCTMPRGIGHTKLHAIFQAEPDYRKWSASMQIPGMKSMEAILAVLPAYTAWKVENQLLASPVAQTVLPTQNQNQIHPSDQMVVVMTGFRNKELEERLTSKGHVVADTITKKTTHVLYPDGPMHSSTKIQKAQAMNIKVQTVTEFLASL